MSSLIVPLVFSLAVATRIGLFGKHEIHIDDCATLPNVAVAVSRTTNFGIVTRLETPLYRTEDDYDNTGDKMYSYYAPKTNWFFKRVDMYYQGKRVY